MKRTIIVLVLVTMTLGALALFSPIPAESKCKYSWDPPYGYECPPCTTMVTCCASPHQCGCVKVPGCKP